MQRLLAIVLLSTLGLKIHAQQYFQNGSTVDFELRLTGTNPMTGTSYCNGKPCEGLLTKKDSNERLSSYFYYTNGKLNGTYETYYPTGSSKSIGRMNNNYNAGIRIEYYENGMIKSVEYFPENQPGILDGTEKITYYENGMVESNYAYRLEWIPIFHYEFSETGDTLMKIEPSQQDSTLFEITEFEDYQQTTKRQFRFNEEGHREFITEKK